MNNKKKILFISPLPPPFYGSAMSSKMCLEVLQKNSSFDVKNIRTNYSQTFDDIGKLTFKKIAGFFIVLYKVAIYCKRNKPNLVYFMPATADFGFIRDFSISILLKLFRQKVIYHIRTQITKSDKNNKLKNYIYKKAFTNNKVIVLGKELATDIFPYFNKKDIFILPNAIGKSLSESELKQIEENRYSSKTLRLVFLSNMMKSKGWPIALHAAHILKQMDIDFTFTFAGSLPSEAEKTEFKNLVETYSLENEVKYIGYVDKEKKHELLSNSDILVFPTEYQYEALPRVIIEAMEYGMPVVANTNGSIPSIILHNTTGFLLKDNTAQEIASYINKIKEKEQRIEMGRMARNRFLSDYELSVYGINLNNIILNAL